MMNWSGKARILVVLALLCGVLPARAATVHWKTSAIDYSAEGKDIKDVLRDFASSQGVPADIASDVNGTFSGKFHLAPQKFLETLASSFGFVWYYDGQMLEITAASDMKSSLLKLDSASTSALRDALRRLHIEDPRFPIVYDDVEGTVIVNGPPRYVQMVTDVADRLDSRAARHGTSEVRVFPLHHAWAIDRTVNIDGNPVTLQGVAGVLNSVYHSDSAASQKDGASAVHGNVTRNNPMNDVSGGVNGGGLSSSLSGNGSSGSSASYGSGSVPPIPPMGQAGGMLAGLTGAPSPILSQSLSGFGNKRQPGGDADNSGSADTELPVIKPDQRTNSILIRDMPDRMSQYQELIDRLDVKPRLIEIEAHIIEIDDGALSQLGINWTAHNSHLDIQTGTGTQAQNTYNGSVMQNFGMTTLPGDTSVAATPVGLSLTAVLGDAGRYLLSNVSALAQTNKARIDASPAVVTLDNIEAVMNNTTQFFVPVSGYTSADLYSVSTGVSLRVLPMVVEEQGKTQIKLDVAIQDGQVTSQTVSNLPVITNSTIDTQAFISQGEALLVAGYRVANDSNDVTGIPWLSKLPVIGALFRTTSKNYSHMERLFLLTPKLIEP